MIHLDTCFLIRALIEGTPQATALDRWVKEGTVLGISTVAWCEFLCGPVTADHVALATSALGGPVAFLPEDSVSAASLFNLSGRRRGTLLDCMIAALALRHGAEVATVNEGDFAPFVSLGLRLHTVL